MNIVKQLREQAQEIAKEGIAGWGNTMVIAANEIERLQSIQQVGNVNVDKSGCTCPFREKYVDGDYLCCPNCGSRAFIRKA